MKMKNQIAALAVLIALTACKPGEQSASDKSANLTDTTKTAQSQEQQQNSPAQTALSPKTDTPAATIAETKEQFVASMEQKLNELDARITELSQKSADYKDATKNQADTDLATLRDERDKAKQKLDQAKAAGADSWQQLKLGVELAVNQLQATYDTLKSKFN